MMTDTDYVFRNASGEVIENACQQWDLYPCQYWFPWSKPFSRKIGRLSRLDPYAAASPQKSSETKKHMIDCAEETEEPDEPSVWVIGCMMSRVDRESADDV